jgi:hypothetical protein
VAVARLSAGAPGGVGERPLGDDPEAAPPRERQSAVERLLVGDAQRDLQRVEASALDGVARGGAVAAVADVARHSPRTRHFERLDRVAAA